MFSRECPKQVSDGGSGGRGIFEDIVKVLTRTVGVKWLDLVVVVCGAFM
jgi:hypothetical protein